MRWLPLARHWRWDDPDGCLIQTDIFLFLAELANPSESYYEWSELRLLDTLLINH